MKIIQLNSYITLNGGSETVMSNISSLLEEKGHSVINMGYTSIKEKKLMPNSHSLGLEKYSLSTFFHEKKTVDFIISKINESETALVICHNVYHKYPMADLLKAIKDRTNAKLILIFHDYKAVCPRCNLYNGKRICTDCNQKKFANVIRHRCRNKSVVQSTILAIDSYYNNSYRDVYSFPDLFITPSHFMAKQLNRMGFNHDIKVIHNPINIRQITRSKNMQGFQQTVLYAGRFSKDKGIELFLQAADKLKNIKFLIAGVGDMIKMVEEADREMNNVEYLGSLNKEQLFDAFDRSDYLILPSIWYENNPMIIIEAMTYGLAVIGSDIGGIPELLNEGRGYLFDPLKPGTLPELIEKLNNISISEYNKTSESAKIFAQTLSSDHYYENLCRLIP
ncbi:MAG TPA: glycosyltransferase family 4 protein, partial [Puia sp.]